MTSLYVVLVDDGIQAVVVGPFVGETSTDDYVRELAEELAGAGVSATSRRVALIGGTLPIGDVVSVLVAQRSAELRRLAALDGVVVREEGIIK